MPYLLDTECTDCDRGCTTFCSYHRGRCGRHLCGCRFVWVGEKFVEIEGRIVHASGIGTDGYGRRRIHELGEYNWRRSDSERPDRAGMLWILFRSVDAG